MDSSTEEIATTSVDIVHGDKHILIEAVAGDHIAATIAATKKFYEWQFLGTLAEYLAPGDLVVDVGANIGNHSLYFAAVCGTNVISFEPLPLAAEILQRNIAVNSLQEQVEVRRKALGEHATKARLEKLDLTNVGATAFAVSPDGDFVVSTLDLEDIQKRVSLIKVDAEGMDIAVLKGAVGLIERDRPMIACEAATAAQQADLEHFASELGYSFIFRFNATATYVLAPARTALERAKIERRAAGVITSTHWATRDLYYRVGLVASELKSVRAVQESLTTPTSSGHRVDSVIADLSKRVEELESLVSELTARMDRDSSSVD
ncbi:FkbM family methyltransferase [Paenarthrobacter nitroguajacolicus]|uniref:FkbM family methyltransferase n=2 Tax=Paenarthrobacter TaxID=1742992 RepID=UPI0028643F5B|nr:FkbM family methyltransferase [Paenarthrobacter nitroguajacolicus]MDR6987953.1 FkbM family methyltransferase [Paenarthrobacter nitroguajacolicus]